MAIQDGVVAITYFALKIKKEYFLILLLIQLRYESHHKHRAIV